MEVTPQSASDEQLYKAAALVLRDLMLEKRRAHRQKVTAEKKKRIHYLSMEFLMGKSLKNSLYNLGLVEPFTEALTAFGATPERLYACEPDPGLGNGGLGRLAAAIWTAWQPTAITAPAIPSCTNTAFSSRSW